MAISEKLIDSGAFCAFVTHYQPLPKLEEYYPQVKNVHFKTIIKYINNRESRESTLSDPIKHFIEKNDNQKLEVNFPHEVANGPSDTQNEYGIVMADLCEFPSELIKNARTSKLIIQKKNEIKISYRNELVENLRLGYSILQSLILLGKNSNNVTSVKLFVSQLKEKIGILKLSEIISQFKL